AAALDIAEQETPTMEAVLATLGDRAAVVVLDNFERLLASADAVSKLLGGAPRVRALVTSRTPLGLAGEHEYAVAPLDVPAESEAFEALARNDSVSVFVARAQAADRLEERGAHPVRDRHARYYPLLADRLGPELIGPQMPTAREQLTADHGNLRAALAHALTREPELGFRLIGALRPYWGATTRGS